MAALGSAPMLGPASNFAHVITIIPIADKQIGLKGTVDEKNNICVWDFCENFSSIEGKDYYITIM